MSPSTFIDSNQKVLITRLQRLVRTETPNPPGKNYDAITRYLVGELEGLGLKTRRYSIPQAVLRESLPPDQQVFPRFNVLGKLAVPGATKTVHFNAHYDVVPVSGRWKHGNPFSGQVEDGWIYGRGTADMKGSIASLLLALRALRATRTSPRLNLEVSFTADEETDSLLGTGWLVQKRPDPARLCHRDGGRREGLHLLRA